MIGRVTECPTKVWLWWDSLYYETKGAIKHEFPLKNGTMYTHFWYFFLFLGGFFLFCTTNILITYFLKKKNLYRTMMRCNPIILYWEKNIFSVRALRNFATYYWPFYTRRIVNEPPNKKFHVKTKNTKNVKKNFFRVISK